MTDLRTLASAATPGPWVADQATVIAGDSAIGQMQRAPDADYVVATSPDVVLALLDVAEAANVVAYALDDGGERGSGWRGLRAGQRHRVERLLLALAALDASLGKSAP